MRWCFGTGVCLLVAGCAAAAGDPAPVSAPALAAPALAASTVRAAPSVTPPFTSTALQQEVPTVVFEPLAVAESPEPMPHVEILFPFFGKVVPMGKAADYEVRLEVESWSGAVQLALDSYRPVLLEGRRRVPLRELVPADCDLTAGLHRLFAVALDERGIAIRPKGAASRGPFSVVEFRVGTREPLEGDTVFLAYSQPRGTYNGDAAADGIFVDFYLVGAELSPSGPRVEVAVSQGEWRSSEVLDRWRPLAIRGLPSGDFDVRVTLLDPSGVPRKGMSAQRTITINRDAPLPPEVARGP